MTSYSQFGEDQWIMENLPLPETGVFVDVGAGDGISLSNTLAFEEKGWTGLCIDADPRNFPALRERRKTALLCAIRDYAGLTKLFFNDGNPDFTRVTGTVGAGYDAKLPCLPLETVLREFNITTIDLLSIDVEGIEREVLSSCNLRSLLPTVIIVEYMTRGYADQKAALLSYFTAFPYRLVHETESNLIFQRL